MMKAIAKEARMQTDFLAGEPVHTIYFGGGTPSLLDVEEIGALMDVLQTDYNVRSGAEVTLEANPDDITEEKLAGWKNVGINRLSIGVQSFFEEELRWMNRAHDSLQSIESLRLATKYFDNISMDLIYGSPLLTDEMWEENIQKAIDLGIPHLSCYALTVEEKTPLHKSIFKKEKENVDSDKQARQFLVLMERLRANGYEHYEVSNFAKPGYRSRHNSSYWRGDTYLGLGPSAHSFDGKNRQWNIANNVSYIHIINDGKIPAEKEVLTDADRLNEFIMISLRTIEGLDLNVVEKKWGEEKSRFIRQQLQSYVSLELVKEIDGSYSLTDEGMLRADGIASELFVVDSLSR